MISDRLPPMIQCPESLTTWTMTRDLTKHLKRGHRWIYSDALDGPRAPTSSGLAFLAYRKQILGIGIVQPQTALRFRLLCLADEVFFKKNNPQKTIQLYTELQWRRSLELRRFLDLSVTNSFRLLNGEGDGFPGLVVDIFGDTAVIKCDQPSLETVWDAKALALWIQRDLQQIQCVYLKRRSDQKDKGEVLLGELKAEVSFLENNVRFVANIREGAKTGFFLDQRDNRLLLSRFCRNKSVLNLFSYTGGFSVFAAVGGATRVTSVDIAGPAIAGVQKNWELNQLDVPATNVVADVFDFVTEAIQSKATYDVVITDPPSFAPNEKSVPQAMAAYIKIFSDSIKLVQRDGYFVASSCSSHINAAAFLEILREAFSRARRRGTLIYIGGQPPDHPFPLAMEELRYLKFALFRVESTD